MSSYTEFVKQEILGHFADGRSKAGDVLHAGSFSMRRRSWNPKQQDAYDSGVQELAADGMVEINSGSVVLTEKGVEFIYPEVGSSVRDAILSCFAEGNARAGHALNWGVIRYRYANSWNPKQHAALSSVIDELTVDGLVEEKNSCLLLTQKGEETIY